MKKILVIIFIYILILVSCDELTDNNMENANDNAQEESISIEGKVQEINDLEIDEGEELAIELKNNNNFSNFMINELEELLQDDILRVVYGDVDVKLENDYYKLTTNNKTSVILDEETNLLRMTWIVSGKGKRGNGYKREPDMPKNMEKGHIKSIYEGAEDNSIEDSPLNIIPQTEVVNDPNIKEFEKYRVEKCQGDLVITTILSPRLVQVEIPAKGIDVEYDPTSEKEFGDDWWFQEKVK